MADSTVLSDGILEVRLVICSTVYPQRSNHTLVIESSVELVTNRSRTQQRRFDRRCHHRQIDFNAISRTRVSSERTIRTLGRHLNKRCTILSTNKDDIALQTDHVVSSWYCCIGGCCLI